MLKRPPFKAALYSEDRLKQTATQLGLANDEYMRIVEMAKLQDNADFTRTLQGVEILNETANNRLKNFIVSAERIWKTLSAQVRFWRAKRLAIKLQSCLRTYLAETRETRVKKKTSELAGLLALLSNVHTILGLKRRAALKIQNFYRMHKASGEYKVLRKLKISNEAATTIQKTFRGAWTREQVKPDLARHKMLKAIRIMQASIRRIMCTKIIYLSALKRYRDRSACKIQRFFRKLKFKEKLNKLSGLRFLAVRAKFIAYILAQSQIRIARFYRGHFVRKTHVSVVSRLRRLHHDLQQRRLLRVSATKIQAAWRGCLIRQQFRIIRRLTLALQIRMRTSLARREFLGPRLPFKLT